MKYNLVRQIGSKEKKEYWCVVVFEKFGEFKISDFYHYHGYYETPLKILKDFPKLMSDPFNIVFEESLLFFDENKQKVVLEFETINELKTFFDKNPELMI